MQFDAETCWYWQAKICSEHRAQGLSSEARERQLWAGKLGDDFDGLTTSIITLQKNRRSSAFGHTANKVCSN